MTIEEVIAIAKTLRPNSRFIQACMQLEHKDEYGVSLQIDDDAWWGFKWEEVLKDAGWKG